MHVSLHKYFVFLVVCRYPYVTDDENSYFIVPTKSTTELQGSLVNETIRTLSFSCAR
jgi:hypothetical protein